MLLALKYSLASNYRWGWLPSVLLLKVQKLRRFQIHANKFEQLKYYNKIIALLNANYTHTQIL